MCAGLRRQVSALSIIHIPAGSKRVNLYYLWGYPVRMVTREVEELIRKDLVYVNRLEVTPAKKTTYHTHNFVEIVYIAEGSGIHRIGDEVFHVEKGDLALINYDVPHQICVTEGTLVDYNFLFTPEYLDSTLKTTRNFFDMSHHFLLGNFYRRGFERYIHVTVSGKEHVHLLNIYERLLREYEQRQIGYREIMRGYLIELLITIFRLNMQERTDGTAELSEVLDYIGTHFTQELRLEQLAAMAECSVSTFCRRFRALTGVTAIRYVQNLRIEHACGLLCRTDKTVIETANEVGYSDIRHFYEVFKKVTGKLPKDFRPQSRP